MHTIALAYTAAGLGAAVVFLLRGLVMTSAPTPLSDNRIEHKAIVTAAIFLVAAQSVLFVAPVGHIYTSEIWEDGTLTDDGLQVDRISTTYRMQPVTFAAIHVRALPLILAPVLLLMLPTLFFRSWLRPSIEALTSGLLASYPLFGMSDVGLVFMPCSISLLIAAFAAATNPNRTRVP